MKTDIAANLAFFLLEQTGSIFSKVQMRMSKKLQNEMFCWYFGDEPLIIDGENETITAYQRHGNTDTVKIFKWSEFEMID